MATRARKLYDQSHVDAVGQALAALSERPPTKAKLGAADIIREHASTIRGLLDRGYSLEEIAASLQGTGVEIVPVSIGRAVREAIEASTEQSAKPKNKRRKKSSNKTDAKNTTATSQTTAANPEVQNEAATPTEEAPPMNQPSLIRNGVLGGVYPRRLQP